MKFELFLNFDGNCREALDFYAGVFRSEVKELMGYEDAPPDDFYVMPEADRGRVMYASVRIGDMTVMFCDVPAGSPHVVGDNISPTLSVGDADEVRRLYDALQEGGGKVHMELQKTFFNELYGMVEDRFGIVWNVLVQEGM